MTELLKMQDKDLTKEIREQRDEVMKLRHHVKMGSEKNSAKYIAAKKQLARMKTALTAKQIEAENAERNTKESVPSDSTKS